MLNETDILKTNMYDSIYDNINKIKNDKEQAEAVKKAAKDAENLANLMK